MVVESSLSSTFCLYGTVDSTRQWNNRFDVHGCTPWGKNPSNPELPLSDHEIASLASAAEIPAVHDTMKVFSTTTTFVVSTNFQRLITCYPTDPSYSVWLKRMKAKRKGWDGRKQNEFADTMATRKKASKLKQRDNKKAFKLKRRESNRKKKRDRRSRLKKNHHRNNPHDKRCPVKGGGPSKEIVVVGRSNKKLQTTASSMSLLT
jgi:hypothetical protein